MSKIFKKISVTAAAVLAISSSAWAIELEKDDKKNQSDERKNSQMSKHQSKQKEGLYSKFADDMFSHADADKNGSVSRSEMLAIASAEFDRRDLDNDGKITKEEVKDFYKNMTKNYSKENYTQNIYKYHQKINQNIDSGPVPNVKNEENQEKK